MKMVNKFKKVLDEGKVAVGTCVDSYSPAVIEITGYSGLDFCRIDSEYSWRRDESMEHMMRAAALVGITPMVRVEKGNPYLISKAFQVGAGAILVSDIANYEEALAVVKASKFAPRGIRGFSSFSFSGGWGTRGGEDWVNWSDTELLVGIMVENEHIIPHLDQIFAIEGLDYCLFGPADYSMSLGLRSAKKNHPKVQEAIKRTVEAAAKHKKAVGIGIGEPWEEEAKKYMDMGCRFIEIGHELGILSSVWNSAGSRIRALER
ncbi:MAG: aldolase/citrate lyase family protein [Thermodesulfobacteriota bacterium]|nr:aldolase/citrate lyase family protein [Thermodesulfobacteriota bacterium]